MKDNLMTVRCNFEICIPKTSKRNAVKLMNEAIGSILNECDNFDSLFESFDEIYGEENDGYSYGFGNPKIVD